jgi:hypothetical protein
MNFMGEARREVFFEKCPPRAAKAKNFREKPVRQQRGSVGRVSETLPAILPAK